MYFSTDIYQKKSFIVSDTMSFIHSLHRGLKYFSHLLHFVVLSLAEQEMGRCQLVLMTKYSSIREKSR